MCRPNDFTGQNGKIYCWSSKSGNTSRSNWRGLPKQAHGAESDGSFPNNGLWFYCAFLCQSGSKHSHCLQTAIWPFWGLFQRHPTSILNRRRKSPYIAGFSSAKRIFLSILFLCVFVCFSPRCRLVPGWTRERGLSSRYASGKSRRWTWVITRPLGLPCRTYRNHTEPNSESEATVQFHETKTIRDNLRQ